MKYCLIFGEHKGDPCSCGWSSENDIECFLDKQIEECRIQLNETEKTDKAMITYLHGLIDGLSRVLLWLNFRENQ